LSERYLVDIRELLKPFNPWWSDPEWYEKDPLIHEYQSGNFRFTSRLYFHIVKNIVKQGKYGITTIRGPRRSGKTTLIKYLIISLIKDYRVNPSDIYYISLDYDGLRDVKLFQILQAISKQGETEKYVFLDEASMYSNWALELKNAYDANLINQGRLKIVATGSHSMDLAEATEKLRGRQGDLAMEFNLGGNLLFTPLRFPEVVEGVRKEVRRILDEGRRRRVRARFEALMALRNGEITSELLELNTQFNILSELLENYLVHGGYPKAVKEFYEKGSVDSNFYFDIAELLIKDSKRAGLDPDTLKKMLSELVKPDRLSGVLDLSFLADSVRNLDKQEIDRYLKYLTSTWAFFFSYRERKDSECKPNYQEQQKLYVLDPFIFHALYSYINNIPDPFEASKKTVEREEFRGLFIESVVASHLILSQQLFAHVPHVNYDKVLMYGVRDQGGHREVDFILCVNRDNELYRFIIESKYRRKVPMDPTLKNTIVLTRNTFKADKERKVTYIPAPLFLMLF
jgi:predicted AAA+ superfamily ATPase